MEREIDTLRQKAEEDKKQMEEQHKRDLEAMQLQVHAKEAAHSQRVLAHQMALTEKLWALESRCEAMKQAETEMRQKYEVERQLFEKEKQQAQRLLEEVRRQAELQAELQAASMQCKQCDEQKLIIKKRQGEIKALEMAIQDQKNKLMEQLELELQRQHVNEMLGIEAMKQAETEMRQKYEVERQLFEKEKQQAQRLLEEANRHAKLQAAMQCKQRDEQKIIIKKHEWKIKALEMAIQDQTKKWMEREQLERQLLELQGQHVKEMERIAELEEEQEGLQDMVNALMQKERIANDFLEEARKVAAEVLDKYGKSDKIDNKLMGTIDERPWRAICKKKFNNRTKTHPYGWQKKMVTMISEWEVRMKDETYHPFKIINLGGGNFERIIDEDEPRLKRLKEDMGEEVMQTVATAFFEIEEYNASGRYPVNVAWNFQKNERVSLKDVLLYLKELLDAPGKAKKKRGRAI